MDIHHEDCSTDEHVPMRAIRVKFADAALNFVTDINGTRAEIAAYYNRPINVGTGTEERFEQPIAIEFLSTHVQGLEGRHTVIFELQEPPKKRFQITHVVNPYRDNRTKEITKDYGIVEARNASDARNIAREKFGLPWVAFLQASEIVSISDLKSQ